MKIIRVFDFTDKRNECRSEYMLSRFKEIFKSMKEPVYMIFEDKDGNYVSLKNKNGAVEYRAIGTHSQCMSLLCDLKEIERRKNEI